MRVVKYFRMNCSPVGAAELVRQSLKNVLEDGGFKIPFANASSASTSAARLLEWASKEENATALQSFASKVTASLIMAFGSRVKKIKLQREKMPKTTKFALLLNFYLCGHPLPQQHWASLQVLYSHST